jgi:hypothetical protein
MFLLILADQAGDVVAVVLLQVDRPELDLAFEGLVVRGRRGALGRGSGDAAGGEEGQRERAGR